MQAVILAGGKGTRLGSLTQSCPKPLLPVAGAPFIDLLLSELASTGIDSIIVSAGHLGEMIRRHVDELDKHQFGECRIDVIVEQQALGTGGALEYLKDHLEPEFLLLNGDSWFDFDLKDFLDRPLADSDILKLALRHVEDISRYGAVELDGDRVLSFIEKGGQGGGLISCGIYHLKKEVIAYLTPPPCSLELDVLPRLAAEKRIAGYAYDGYFIDIGIPDTYERSQVEIHQRIGSR